MLLDRILRDYQFHEVHSVAVNATGAQVFAALGAVTSGELPLFRLLMRVRSLPALAAGRRQEFGRGRGSLLEQAKQAGFTVLDYEGDRELVLGTVGKPWRLVGGVAPPRVRSAEEFIAFSDPGWAKIATNFLFDEAGSRSGAIRLRTETRVWLADAATARRFAAYWVLIRPGSGLIRREWLRRIKERAEASASSRS